MIIFAGILFSTMFIIIMGALIPWAWTGAAILLDMVSLILVLLPLAFYLVAAKDGAVIAGYIKGSFQKGYVYGAAELENIARAAKYAAKVVLAAGGFGFIAGIMFMLGNLDDPSHLGPFIAVSLVTLFYSIAIGFFIFVPLRAWAENKLSAFQRDKSS